MDAEISSSNLTSETQREGQNVVMVAFNANVKEVSHAGIVWAMEHVLKRGDILTIVSVLDSVHGHRVKIGDQKWLSTNQKLMEKEIQQKMQVWRRFPGLANRCAEEGVKLVVLVKAGELELTVCREAMKLRACHVVLDKSLKCNRRREFYRLNLSCNVTRMRKSGGVDVIRPSLDRMKSSTSETTLWFPPPLLSYDDQVDEFQISLGVPKTKRRNSTTPKPTPPLPSPEYSGKLKSRELRRLPSSATADERSSSITQSTHGRPSSESSVNRPSFTSSSNAMDDDLFRIFHGSTRHTDIDTNSYSSGYDSDDLFSIGTGSTRHTDIDTNPYSSGYKSDDLFSIGTSSTRHTEIETDLFSNTKPSSSDYDGEDLFSIAPSPAPPLEFYHHSHNSQPSHRHSSSSIPDTNISMETSQRSTNTTPSSSHELIISEPSQFQQSLHSNHKP